MQQLYINSLCISKKSSTRYIVVGNLSLVIISIIFINDNLYEDLCIFRIRNSFKLGWWSFSKPNNRQILKRFQHNKACKNKKKIKIKQNQEAV